MNSSAVPFAFMFVLSVTTFVGVLLARRRVHSSNMSNGSCASEPANRRTRIRDMKFGTTIIVLNLFFMFSNFPHRIYYFVKFNPFDSRSHPLAHYFFSASLRAIYESYFSITFVVQLAVNILVRRELVNILKKSAGNFRRRILVFL